MSKAAPGAPSRNDESGHVIGGLSALTEHRREIARRRARIAAPRLAALVAELAEFASDDPSVDLEDELCARLGDQLWQWSNPPRTEDYIDTDVAVEVLAAQAVAAVGSALGQLAADPHGGRGHWQVLRTVADIVDSDLHEVIADQIEELRGQPGGEALPALPPAPALAGQVLWTRDAYGSRFGVTAPFSAPDRPTRWYLWDIDACGLTEPLTAHSAYYPGPEQALDAWRAGVGPVATDGAAFAPVDDPYLLIDLLPSHRFMRIGGETAAQLIEYHRGRSLAEIVLEAIDAPLDDLPTTDLDAEIATKEFLAWWRASHPHQPPPADSDHPADGSIEDYAEQLAQSWQVGGVPRLYHTCSPHRVALLVPHLRNYYQDDYAAELIALLPEWIAWLTRTCVILTV